MALVVVVVLAHLVVLWWLGDRGGLAGPSGESLKRIDVAFVQELSQSEPPAAPVVPPPTLAPQPVVVPPPVQPEAPPPEVRPAEVPAAAEPADAAASAALAETAASVPLAQAAASAAGAEPAAAAATAEAPASAAMTAVTSSAAAAAASAPSVASAAALAGAAALAAPTTEAAPTPAAPPGNSGLTLPDAVAMAAAPPSPALVVLAAAPAAPTAPAPEVVMPPPAATPPAPMPPMAPAPAPVPVPVPVLPPPPAPTPTPPEGLPALPVAPPTAPGRMLATPTAPSGAGAPAVAGAAVFEWPPSTRLTYTLTGDYRGPIQGRARVDWLRSGSRYQVHLDVEVAPLLARRMSSDGLLTENGLQPQRYEEETRVLLRASRRRLVLFEPGKVLLPGQDAVPAPAGVQDTASQFVQLTWLFTTRPHLLRAGESVEVPLALPRRVGRWVYDVVRQEMLETPVGRVPAWYLRPRPENPGRTELAVEVWIAPTLQYLPARIRIQQDTDGYIDLLLERLPQQAAPSPAAPGVGR